MIRVETEDENDPEARLRKDLKLIYIVKKFFTEHYYHQPYEWCFLKLILFSQFSNSRRWNKGRNYCGTYLGCYCLTWIKIRSRSDQI